MDQDNPMVSVVIPTVNQVELVVQCLTSLLESGPSEQYSYEIIIADDGSPAEIQQSLAKALSSFSVTLLTKPVNQGFAATVNWGATRSKGQWICLLNNDVTFTQKNWLDLLLQVSREERVGVVGPRLLYPDGRIQHGGVIYVPETGIFDHEYRNQPGSYPPALQTRQVLGVTGAVLLINRNLWNLLGGMDERFFVGMEDVDFCLRTWQQGWRVYYVGKAVAVHHELYTRGSSPYWQSKGVESHYKFGEKWRHRLILLRQLSGMSDSAARDPDSISAKQALLWRKIVNNRCSGSSFSFSSPKPQVYVFRNL